MKIGPKYLFVLLAAGALASASGCQKAQENRNATSPASSGVMSSTTGPNGVAGEGNTASDAGAIASTASGDLVPESQAPVATTPSTGASATSSGASQ